ncbi:hypothetical protein GCM10012276_38210 [Nocardioides deserti]|nr:hypothetical protein GCM10012276_38210 [Nocardioides deserti]
MPLTWADVVSVYHGKLPSCGEYLDMDWNNARVYVESQVCGVKRVARDYDDEIRTNIRHAILDGELRP